MHKRIYGVFNLELTLSPQSDLLVQRANAEESKTSARERKPPMQFFRARHPETGELTACIPGPSFKGVLRSTGEKILRSFDATLACDPFEEDPSTQRCGCSHRLTAEKKSGQKWRSSEMYGLVCPACRVFGSLAHAGLIEVEDAWATREDQSSKQERIAIDRLLGGVAPSAMYKMKPLVPESRFETKLTVTNFELWQIGLLALTLRELNDGQALIGWGTRRGLGRVSVHFTNLSMRYPRALYDTARESHNGTGKIPAAQSLIPLAQRKDIAYSVEDLWLGENASSYDSGDWRDADWRDFRIGAKDQIDVFFGECVEKALAPKLQRGPAGFAYEVRSEE